MTADYWPARAAYLRRGTPVAPALGSAGIALQTVDEDGDVPVAWGQGVTRVPVAELLLDLRDATARAHAAWAWIKAGHGGTILEIDGQPLVSVAHLGVDATWLALVLSRMACGDEAVTVEQARAALAWVELQDSMQVRKEDK